MMFIINLYSFIFKDINIKGFNFIDEKMILHYVIYYYSNILEVHLDQVISLSNFDGLELSISNNLTER